LQRGAVGAGLVWTAPALRSVHRLVAPGTPTPTTPSTAPPAATTYRLDGSDTNFVPGFASRPGCGFVVITSFDVDFPDLGLSHVVLEGCAGPDDDPRPDVEQY